MNWCFFFGHPMPGRALLVWGTEDRSEDCLHRDIHVFMVASSRLKRRTVFPAGRRESKKFHHWYTAITCTEEENQKTTNLS